MNNFDHKDHKYPTDKKSKMSSADKDVYGGKKETTTKGPHLNSGKGTPYQQAAIGKGFMTHHDHPGHNQKSNIDGVK